MTGAAIETPLVRRLQLLMKRMQEAGDRGESRKARALLVAIAAGAIGVLTACASVVGGDVTAAPTIAQAREYCRAYDDAVSRILLIRMRAPIAEDDSLVAVQADVKRLYVPEDQFSAADVEKMRDAVAYIVAASDIDAFGAQEWQVLAGGADAVCVNTGAFGTMTSDGG